MQRFKNILYLNEATVDQSSAIERAVRLAEKNQAELTVIDVIPTLAVSAGIGLPTGGGISDGLRAFVESDRRKGMEAMIQPYAERLQIKLDVLVGKTFLEAIRAVLRNQFDLLIKAAENPAWTTRIFGSDDLHLLRKCPCPVWLIKPQEKTQYSTIMAAVDFDPATPFPVEQDLNRQILELSASLALSDLTSLHVVHAWGTLAEKTLVSRGGMLPEGLNLYLEKEEALHRKELFRLVEKLRGWVGDEAYGYLSLSLHLPKGSSKRVIAEMAARLGADLVVMGTVARTGIPGLIIGNTAEAVLDQLACSVLAVKPPGFTTPVKIDS